MNSKLQKRYCSIKELSSYTGLPTSTLYEWARLGVIPSIKINKRVLFDLKDIDDLFDGLKKPRNLIEKPLSKILAEAQPYNVL